MRTPITIKGVRYPSKSAAARALDMHLNTLLNREQNGNPLDAPKDLRYMPTPKPVRVGKVKYRSQAAAAIALGMDFRTLSERIKRHIPLDRPVRKTRPRTTKING